MLNSLDVLEKNVGRSRGYSLNHNGIDLLAPRYTKVKARYSGILTNGTNPKGQDFGNYSVVKYDGVTYQGWYAHLEKFLVKSGSRVAKGQVIALSGNSGYVLPKPTWYNPNAGSHLHYGESVKGTVKWLNPDGTVGPKPPAPPPSVIKYTIKSGDSLSKIATLYKTTVAQLVTWNKAKYPSLASNPNLIQVGWVIRVK